jgi:hypothetical protein
MVQKYLRLAVFLLFCNFLLKSSSLVKLAKIVCVAHQPSLGPRGGLWPVLLLCVIYKEDVCPSSGGINRLMMMMNSCTFENWHRSSLKFPGERI